MKKNSIFLLAILFFACKGTDENAAETEMTKEQPLAQSANSEMFNTQFGQLLTNYFHLKDALVLTSDSLANTAAQLLKSSADSISFKDTKADSSIVEMAKGYVESISAEATGLQSEKDIDGKRKSFQVISDNLYDLIRTVRYDRQKIYHQFCPMAFNDQGAYWLSPNSDIKNPYFGKKMLTCGEVKDSINFSGK